MSEPVRYSDSEHPAIDALNETAGPDDFDPVIEAYMKHVDRTLLRENLKLTPQQRGEKFLAFMKGIYEMRGKANPKIKVWR